MSGKIYYDVQDKVIEDVRLERYAQDQKFGVQNHANDFWALILGEEVGEVSKAILENQFYGTSESHIRAELIQVAAVAIAIVECIDRRSA